MTAAKAAQKRYFDARRAEAVSLRTVASLRLTLVLFGLLGAALVAVNLTQWPATWLIAVPCALLAVNLLAAIAAHPAFRLRMPLLVFHLALAAVLLLAAMGRMTHLKGELELSTGDTFEGVLTRTQAAPWHRSKLGEVRFTNAGYAIDYAPGVKRGRTANRIVWRDESGFERESVVGDDVPFTLFGYRFYTSFNKGFAPIVRWQPANGSPVQRGTIHLPSYPLHEHGQAQEWTPPGADAKLWLMLKFDEMLLDPERHSQFRLPQRHTLIVREGARRVELAPGGGMDLAQGTLVYEGLTTWMGYTVFSDWTLPWLVVASLVATAGLAWHFASRFAARSWMSPC